MNNLDELKKSMRGYDVVRAAGTVTISKKCTITKEPYAVHVPARDYDAFCGDVLAQRAFPYLDADQREFIISGTTPAEWAALEMDKDEP